MKDFGNRVEGTDVELHGGEDLTLLGVHRSFELFAKNSTLQVRFYLPRAVSTKVSVEGREIVDTRHYLMRSKQANWKEGDWNNFTPWPTKDVIDPLGLDPSNIAVLASYSVENAQLVYLPVDVVARTSQPRKQPYTFHFETSWDLHSLEKSVTGPSGHRTILTTDQCNISPQCVLYSSKSSHVFDVDMSGLPEGVYSIDLVGHIPGASMMPELHIKIYHRPS